MAQDSTMTFELLDAITRTKRTLGSTTVGTRNAGVMTFEKLDAIGYSRAVDRANRYRQSDRGFNTSQVRVHSDGRRTVRLWDHGTMVSFQRTTYGAETSLKAYRHRVVDSTPLKYRKYGYESHYRDCGSTFRPMRRKRAKARRKGTTRRIAAYVNVALGTGSIDAMIFGN
jgi:hypothetical protein